MPLMSNVRRHNTFIMHIALALFCAALVVACGGSSAVSSETNVPFITVASTQNSGVTTREEVVARTQAEMTEVWARYSAASVSPPQPPVVDFAAKQVVGVFLGSRASGCYSVSISRITQTGDRLVVAYREQGPSVGAVCTAAIVNPAHLVAVDRTSLPVEFVAE